MPTEKEILERLRSMRIDRSLNQDYLARELGIDRTTYVRKEKGLIPITTEEWIRLGDALGEDPSCFFTRAQAGGDCYRKEALGDDPLAGLYRALNDQEREDLVGCLTLLLKNVRRKRVQLALKRLKAG